MTPRRMTKTDQRKVRSATLDIYAFKRWWKIPANDNNKNCPVGQRGKRRGDLLSGSAGR